MHVLISDANVLIDLHEGDVLDKFFQLPYEFFVPDTLFDEELAEHHHNLLDMGLHVEGLGSESILYVEALSQKYRGPSINDFFALALARQKSCPLLTGDKALRMAAESEFVEVRGTLWVVEEMVRQGLIDKKTAEEIYVRMQTGGRRLPWAIACERLKII